jgi:hypothetical protein
MINPTNITNYNLTTAELEEHLLFWVCAAGKNGVVAASNLDKFLKNLTLETGRLLRQYVLSVQKTIC